MKKYFSVIVALLVFFEISIAQDPEAPVVAPAPVVALAQAVVPAPAVPGNEIKEYKAQVISTNFTIPIIRFNIIDKKSNAAPTDRKGNVSFFNSIGAGIGYYWGRITEITDKDGKVISSEMHNTFGLQAGFLFAANSSGTNNTNIFAITAGVSILNFQLGYGYELGTIGANDKRGFMTLAYGIPVSKLVNGGFYKIKSDELTSAQKGKGFANF